MKQRIILIALSLFTFTIGKAQDSIYYDAEVFTEAYVELTGATVLIDSAWDEPELPVSFGNNFTFNYFGVEVDSLIIGDYVYFDEDDTWYIDVLYSDWVGRINDLSPISYLIDGTAGDRIFKVEWKNAGFFCEFEDSNSTDDFVNVQLWLYEADSSIEVRVGPNSVNDPVTAFCEEGGPYTGLIFEETGPSPQGVYLAGSVANPTPVYTIPIPHTGMPTNGTVYRFFPVIIQKDTSTVGLNDRLVLDLKLYPNPASNNLSVQLLNDIGAADVLVYDITGRVVLKETVTTTTKMDVDISSLANGIYQVVIEKGEVRYNGRFLKQ